MTNKCQQKIQAKKKIKKFSNKIAVIVSVEKINIVLKERLRRCNKTLFFCAAPPQFYSSCAIIIFQSRRTAFHYYYAAKVCCVAAAATNFLHRLANFSYPLFWQGGVAREKLSLTLLTLDFRKLILMTGLQATQQTNFLMFGKLRQIGSLCFASCKCWPWFWNVLK